MYDKLTIEPVKYSIPTPSSPNESSYVGNCLHWSGYYGQSDRLFHSQIDTSIALRSASRLNNKTVG